MIGTARDLETIEQEIWQIQAAGQAVEWRKAELYTEACVHVTVRQLATDIGKSVSYIHRAMKTLAAFPPDKRVDDPLMSWSHYRQAAETNQPEYWLMQAVDHQWSTRDLADAVKQAQATDPRDEQDRQWAQALQRVRKLVEEAEPDQRQRYFAALDTWRQEWRR